VERQAFKTVSLCCSGQWRPTPLEGCEIDLSCSHFSESVGLTCWVTYFVPVLGFVIC